MKQIWCGISILDWKELMKPGRTGNELMLQTFWHIFAELSRKPEDV